MLNWEANLEQSLEAWEWTKMWSVAAQCTINILAQEKVYKALFCVYMIPARSMTFLASVSTLCFWGLWCPSTFHIWGQWLWIRIYNFICAIHGKTLACNLWEALLHRLIPDLIRSAWKLVFILVTHQVIAKAWRQLSLNFVESMDHGHHDSWKTYLYTERYS